MGIPFPIPTARTKSQIFAVWLHINVFAAERLRLIGSCFATIKTQEDHTMARPKKEESIRRTSNVMVRFSSIEYELVAGYAKDAGYPISTFVRKQALSEKVTVNYNIVADIGEIQKLTAQAAGIGNNLNQIARYFHGGGLASRGMLEDLKKCIAEIRELRQEIVQLGGAYRGNSKTHRK